MPDIANVESREPSVADFYGLSLLRIDDEDNGWIIFRFESGYSIHVPKPPETGALYVHGIGD
jgi:hypothetical protein